MGEKRAKSYSSIVAFCEDKLREHGDNYLGVGWTKRPEDADVRYRVMLEVMDGAHHHAPQTLLDFGCGASHLLDYMRRRGIDGIRYSGLDVSDRFIELSRSKYPDIDYYHVDVLEAPDSLPEADWIVMNGVFTAKVSLSYDQMWDYFRRLLHVVFGKARMGIAFNVMSTQVDWERDDLFHLPMDRLAEFLARDISRHFVIRHDYGLYEYAAYVYRHPRSRA
jgi:SAM-dependent methyltransferase